MNTQPAAVRLGVAKLIGILVGLAGFFTVPVLMPDAAPRLQWAVLLWYTTFGAVIGAFGVTPRHPAIIVPVPWWLRAPLVGAWLNFVLTLFAWDTLKSLLVSFFERTGMEAGEVLTSPWWFALEGAIIGLLIGFIATRFGGRAENAG